MKLGIIEGFYGEDYNWNARSDLVQYMCGEGLSFYIYAPKSARHLRRDWRKDCTTQTMTELLEFREHCRAHNVDFGVGLSPYGLHNDWRDSGRADLIRKVRSLRELGLDWLAILFDDMPGSLPKLAQTQADILNVVTDQDTAEHYLMCPTYYTDAPILDRLFGERPPNYLAKLGRSLDSSINIFWTGPKVVSEDYSDEHLKSVHERLGRKPFIWDNYPVNDGPRMSNFLHIQAPIRRQSSRDLVSGWAINPMNQAVLSRIPIRAVARSLLRGDDASTEDATKASIRHCFPEPIARHLSDDYPVFQSGDRSTFSESQIAHYLERYEQFKHPGAVEVVRWLKGEYVVSAEILTDT